MIEWLKRLFGTEEGYDEEAYETAAIDLTKVYRGDVHGLRPEDRGRVAAKIAAYRQEAEAITDPRWRKAHLSWVRHSERQYAESIKAWERRQCNTKLKAGDPLKTKGTPPQ